MGPTSILAVANRTQPALTGAGLLDSQSSTAESRDGGPPGIMNDDARGEQRREMEAGESDPDSSTLPDAGPSWHADSGDGLPVDDHGPDAPEVAERADVAKATRMAGRHQPLDPPVIPPVPPEEDVDDRDSVAVLPVADGGEARPRVAWIVAVVVLAGTTVAGGVLAVRALHWGDDWKDRAVEAEAEADDLGGRLDATEEDVTTLEAFVTALADQKAILEDKQDVIAAERDSLEDENADATRRAALAADAADKTQVCLDDLRVLIAALGSADATSGGSGSLAPFLAAAQANCAAADASYSALRGAAG